MFLSGISGIRATSSVSISHIDTIDNLIGINLGRMNRIGVYQLNVAGSASKNRGLYAVNPWKNRGSGPTSDFMRITD